MKRLTLLTILLVVLGLTAGFAIDLMPAVTVGGDATLSWGIDLDTMDTGFTNAFTVNFDITFLAATDDTHKGEGDVYGAITLGGFSFLGDNATPAITLPTVTAWIMAGPAEIGVYSAPDFAIDKVAAIEADTDATDEILEDESATDVAPDYDGAGTYVKYPVGPIALKAMVLSDSDWNNDPADNDYALGLDVAATLGPAALGVTFFYDLDAAAMGVGVGATVTAGPVVATAGFDGAYAATFAWEAGAGLTFTIMEGVTAEAKAVYGDAFDLDVMVALTEAEAKGLVDNLAFGVTGYILDVLAGLEYKVVVTGGYKMGNITPSFSLTYGDPFEAGDSVFNATVALTINPIFPLTQFSVTYTSGNFLAATPVMGDVVAALKVTY
jgi:hypothetical protein